jgi:hypothetical protein
VRKLTFFLAAVSSVLFAEKALCRGTTFSIEPESFNSLRYEEIRVEGPIERSIRTGRFLSVDPYLDVKKALHNPQAWNRYSYVMNNPINRLDPDGRADIWFRVVRFLSNEEGKILGFIPIGKKLTVDQAVKARQAGKSIEVTAKTEKAAYRAANEVENKAYPNSQNIHHGKDAHKRAGNQAHVQSDGQPGHSYYRTVAGLVLGLFIPMKVDAAIMLGEAGAEVAAAKGNEAIDKARKESTFGGERRGEAAADEIIEPPG